VDLASDAGRGFGEAFSAVTRRRAFEIGALVLLGAIVAAGCDRRGDRHSPAVSCARASAPRTRLRAGGLRGGGVGLSVGLSASAALHRAATRVPAALSGAGGPNGTGLRHVERGVGDRPLAQDDTGRTGEYGACASAVFRLVADSVATALGG